LVRVALLKRRRRKSVSKKNVPQESKEESPKEDSARAVKSDADEKPAAAVIARKATMAKTMQRVGDTTLVVDADDDIAEQKIARSKRTAVDKASDPPPETGTALVERVTRAVERELMQIETIVGGPPHEAPTAHRGGAPCPHIGIACPYAQ
jgi:hypothetical protein